MVLEQNLTSVWLSRIQVRTAWLISPKEGFRIVFFDFPSKEWSGNWSRRWAFSAALDSRTHTLWACFFSRLNWEMVAQKLYFSEESFNCTTIRTWMFIETSPNSEKVAFFFLCLFFFFFRGYFPPDTWRKGDDYNKRNLRGFPYLGSVVKSP